MKTDDLIARLAGEPAAPPLDNRRIVLLALAAVLGPVAVLLALAGVRAGLGGALSHPMVLPKTLIPLLGFALLLPELLRLARPEGAVQTRLFRLALPLAAALAVLAVTLAWPVDLPAPMLKGGFRDTMLFAVVECVGLISLLSVLPVWAGVRLLQRGAVTRPGLAGAVAGALAGTGAASGYSLFCTRDNPLFYLFWYGVAIVLATLAGWALGRRRLVW